MNESIRQLISSDWLEMGRLRMSKATHAGNAIASLTNTPISFVDQRYQNQPHSAWGLFNEQQQLQAFICCYVVEADKAWVLDLMVSRGNPNHLRQLLDHCLQYHEQQKGITQFYYAFPIKWARAYRTFWRETSPTLQRYAIQDLETIEARRIPRNKWIWDHVLHMTVIQFDLMVRRSFIERIEHARRNR